MSPRPDANHTPITIDDDVEWLTEQIAVLKQIGRKDEVSESEKYDFSIRWGAALAGRLPRLVHYHSRGLLDEADQRRFMALCDELRGLSDVIGRLGLAQPVFTDTPPTRSKRHRVPRPARSRRGLLFRRG
ncbi:MAG: hypothetical protein JO082_09335 [Mycobacterium sp.]|nr:hypothetical protein [Mycobacterium sp.]MBV9722107.1 hypothetical protein [Mycobacterium sp.]